MTASVVLELPPLIREQHDFNDSIVSIEHRKDPICYYGSKVPRVSLDPGAEKLGVFLGMKQVFGNLYQFLLLFEGVAHFVDPKSSAKPHLLWSRRPDGLVNCGASRVYVAPTLLAPLPILR